jgi:multidrug transporter EmrE-like cation transporter
MAAAVSLSMALPAVPGLHTPKVETCHSGDETPMGYAYIAATILLTVYGQVILKWQVSLAGAMPVTVPAKVAFLASLLVKPWILSGFVAAFLASVAWMAAMTKFDLSYAYPFMSINFVLVLVLSAILFHEALSPPKLVGLALIVLGIIVAAQGEQGS